MEQTILKPWQEKVIALVAGEQKMTNFYLTGGTALAAYYLRHRLSDDLDFFCFEEADNVFLHAFAEHTKTEISAENLRYERLYDRNQYFFRVGQDDLKVEFSRYPFRQLEKLELVGGLKIDSFRDITANKLMALIDRFDPKDFVDMFFILKKAKLANVRKDVELKFGMKIDNIFLGGELAKAKRIEALPQMIRLVTKEELKTFFGELAKELAPEVFK